MTTTTVADHLLPRLSEWRRQQLFAYPGDGINAVLAADIARHGSENQIAAPVEQISATSSAD